MTTGNRATSCEAVVHIGDSTSEGLVSAEYLPDRSELIAAQYARVGATTQHLEVSGARSIYENFEGFPTPRKWPKPGRAKGFDGCWVLALGTNEAANVAAGSTFGYDERIDSMMSIDRRRTGDVGERQVTPRRAAPLRRRRT